MANSFKNAGLLVTTTDSVLYISTGKTSVLHGIFLANIIGTQITGTVTFHDASSGSEYNILYNAPILPGSTLVFDKPINLESDDSITVMASDTNSINAFASILEIE